jgi:hypothetical protein
VAAAAARSVQQRWLGLAKMLQTPMTTFNSSNKTNQNLGKNLMATISIALAYTTNLAAYSAGGCFAASDYPQSILH